MLSRQALQDGMATKHPLLEYATAHGKTLEEIAKASGCSRMTLWRLVTGRQNATIDMIQRVSDATDGVVPASAFLPVSPPKTEGATVA